jgi:uncharacterized protein YndB with AHSA1/START domain
VTGTIRLSREYDAPAADLWELVATREGLASWLMANDFESVAGHAFTFTTKPQPPFFDGVVGSRVLRIDPPRLLEIAWTGGGVDTTVTFTLHPTERGGTRLELVHSGFSGLRGRAVQQILGMGWRGLLRTDIPRQLALRS